MNQNLNPLQTQNGFPAAVSPVGTVAAPGADGISLAEFLQILRRRRAVILQSFVLVTVVAVVLTLMTKPVYRATARLLVENASISYNAIDTSQNALVCTGNHDWTDTAFGLIDGGIVIEDGAWVGARATVLSGAHVASHAVIAGGAVLSKATEPYTIYAGNPAVPIRKRVIK